MSAGERYRAHLEELREVAVACGRPAPRLVVVTKNRDPAEIREVHAAGARDFGENRAQALAARREELADLEGVTWHFVGHLQTNKVGKVLGQAAWIHSVDSPRLLDALEGRAEREDMRGVKVLLEVNVSGEDSKYGLAPEELPGAITHAAGCERLELAGLMTMAPYGASEAETDQVFGRLRELHEAQRARPDRAYQGRELSMGMSADFRSATRQGATMVRIGTAIFEGAAG